MISTEQIRIIRTNIDQEDNIKGTCLMVTSPGNVKQKSLITSKLALSFAEQGKRTLLIDANVREPGIHEWFQLDNEHGWTNALLKDESPGQYIKETFQSDLYVLPTGSRVHHPGKLWVSEKIGNLMLIVKEEFDVVIFEAPELLSVADPLVLMNHCDGVIIVARNRHSRRESAIQTKDMIERARKPLVGVIFQTG